MTRKTDLSSLLAYGVLGLPLAMVALPVYVHVPQFYAERFGLSLSAIGLTLLAARVLDAFADPVLGAWIERRHGSYGYAGFIRIAAPLLIAGFVALFHPPEFAEKHPLIWFSGALMLVYGGYSIATIAHQSWGAAWTQERSERSRLTATRETFGLAGVIVAAAMPGWIGFDGLLYLFAATIVASTLLLMTIRQRPQALRSRSGSNSSPFRNAHFRWLLAIFSLNGIAAAIPATLFLFFAKDRLQLADDAGLFLVLYFLAGAVSMPVWAACARAWGEARAWMAGMGLAVSAFIWSFWLPPGSFNGFLAVCIAAGFALGADLALPAALLAAVIAHAGHSGRREGAYFGVWNWSTKMNLALAAGISLPALERLGYIPGVPDASGAQALGVAYALLPCGLKLAAAGLLWKSPLHRY